MAVENLKFWHWMLLGAIAGMLVGYASTLTGPERDPLMRQPMTAQQFAGQLGKVVDGQPLMREIVIHPQRDGQNFVTGEILEVDRYHPFAFYAAAPFVTGQTQSASVLEYVKDRASRDRHISFQYPWTEAGWFIIASRAVAGLVLIGCVWPVLLNLMIGAGLGRKRPSEPEYVLDRFKP